jgi:inhibitor of cysteine peptidase
MSRTLAVALLSLLVAAAPASARTVTVHKKDDGRTVRLHKGDRVVIVLDENPSTGYAWKFTRRPARSVARVASSRYQADPVPPGPPIAGSGGTRTVRLRAVGVGATKLRLTYAGAGNRPSGGRFRLSLRVR